MKTSLLSVSLDGLKQIDPRMDIVDAMKIIAICDGSVLTDQDSFQEDEYPETAAWLRRGYGWPSDQEIRLHMLDEVLQTCGTEAIYSSEDHDDIVAVYCNTGDSYAETIALIYDRKVDCNQKSGDGQFVIASYDDLMEFFKEE